MNFSFIPHFEERVRKRGDRMTCVNLWKQISEQRINFVPPVSTFQYPLQRELIIESQISPCKSLPPPYLTLCKSPPLSSFLNNVFIIKPRYSKYFTLWIHRCFGRMKQFHTSEVNIDKKRYIHPIYTRDKDRNRNRKRERDKDRDRNKER